MANIWLPGYEPLTLEDLAETGKMEAFLGKERKAPPGMFYRGNPFEGDKGPIDIENIIVQAVLHTLTKGQHVHPKYRIDGPPTNMWRFIPSPQVLLKSASFEEKLMIVTDMLREVKDKFDRPSYIESDGSVFNHESIWMVNYDTTDYFWISSKDRFEVLFNTGREDTSFLFYTGGFENAKEFTFLKKQHEKRNLFGEGPINFVYNLCGGWHIPVMGVTEIGFFDDWESKITRLNTQGTEEKGLPEKSWEFKNSRLRPGYVQTDSYPMMIDSNFNKWFSGLETIEKGVL